MNDHGKELLERLLDQRNIDTSNMSLYYTRRIMMRARYLTQPKKKKCSNCQGDLPNTTAAPPVLSQETGKEICADCKLGEFYASMPSDIKTW